MSRKAAVRKNGDGLDAEPSQRLTRSGVGNECGEDGERGSVGEPILTGRTKRGVPIGLVEFACCFGARHLDDHRPVALLLTLEHVSNPGGDDDLGTDLGEQRADRDAVLDGIGFEVLCSRCSTKTAKRTSS